MFSGNKSGNEKRRPCKVGFVLPLKVTRSIFLRTVSYLVD